METATDKAMEEALAIANEAPVAASGAAIAAGVANAATTSPEPTHAAAAVDGESVRAVSDVGGYRANGDASSTPPENPNTVATDEGSPYSENGEVSDATTAVTGGAESATGSDDATTVDEAAPADERSDDVMDDAEAADDGVTTASGTTAGDAAKTAEEAAASDERDIAAETTLAADEMTTGDEVDATHTVLTGESKSVHAWFSPAELSTADWSTATAGEGASAAGGTTVEDEVDAPALIIGDKTAFADERSGEETTANALTTTAGGATDESVETGDGGAGLIIAGEAATMDGRSGANDVTTPGGSTATAEEATGELAGTGDGARAAGAMWLADGIGATGLVIAVDPAMKDQPSETADVIAEDDSTAVEGDDATSPIVIDEAATTDLLSGNDEAVTEDEGTTTAEDVLIDGAVTSDEATTPDQAGTTSATTTLDDTAIIPAVVEEAPTIIPVVPDDATMIIPPVPDDVPVVPPLGRLRVADQPAFRESGQQAARAGTGAATLGAPTTAGAQTTKPKAAVPVTLPAPTPAPTTPVRRRPRRARLKVTRADPWSVMKIAFLLSLAAGIMTVVAVAFLWMALDAAGVFSKVGETVNSVTSGGEDKGFDLEGYLTLSRVLGITGIIAAVEVVVMTALATLLAFMYNVSSGMVGGVEVTLAEDD